MALVRQLHGVKDQLAVGGGEDVAHRLDVQHALAYKARLGGLVAGAAEGDDGDAVRALKRAADDEVALHVNGVRVREGEALQQLVGQGVGVVDKFLHLHCVFLPL